MACQIYSFCISPPAGVARVQIKKKKYVTVKHVYCLRMKVKKMRVKLKINLFQTNICLFSLDKSTK